MEANEFRPMLAVDTNLDVQKIFFVHVRVYAPFFFTYLAVLPGVPDNLVKLPHNMPVLVLLVYRYSK
jgi:hypothetical protein